MTRLTDDTFERNHNSAGREPWSESRTTWSIASSEQKSTTGEMCPICVLLLETEEGIALFAKYMMATISIVADGKGGGTSSSGWQCSMCGASGEGEIPAFHAKPATEN